MSLNSCFLKFIFLILTLKSFPGFADRPKITMSAFQTPEQSPTVRFCEKIYQEAFSRLKMDFSLKILPARRASFEANSGKTDGELARRAEHSVQFPNLVRVEESITTIRFSAFSTDPNIHLKGWNSLKGKNFRIDYLGGIPVIRENLLAFLPAQNLFEVNDRSMALPRLRSGRSDLYIDGEWDMIAMINKETRGAAPLYNAGEMDQFTVYPFLHKKHQDLVKKLAEVLRLLKKEGRLKEIQDQVLGTGSLSKSP